MERTSRQGARLVGDIGDAEPIKESEQKTVEDGEGVRGTAFALLTGIFAKGDIATPMKTISALPSA